MKKNMGRLDRTIRIVTAVVIAVLFWQGIIDGIVAYILLTLSVLFVITSFIGHCPMYRTIDYDSKELD